MKPGTFELLRSLVEPSLEKNSMRTPIEASCRLFSTLMYLSQGVPRQVLAWMFRMEYSTVGAIIFETCDVLWATLMPLYIAPPSESKWKEIAEGFENIWNLPNCVSAIDGKHINITCPPRACSEYYNYKGHHSIVMLAACDAKYTFTMVDVGGVFELSSFGKAILNGILNLPSPRILPNSTITFNYFLVGDSAFPLKHFLMQPYPGKLLDEKKSYFNRRLSRARRVIENAFGILVAKWRILQNTLNMMPSNADRTVKASIVLHNFVKINDVAYCPPDYVDSYDENGEIAQRGLWRNETEPLSQARPSISNNSSRAAFEMRDQLKDYLFTNPINFHNN